MNFLSIYLPVLLIIRLYFLRVSRTNEAKILADGGYEKGKGPTQGLILLHLLFYLSSISYYYYTEYIQHSYSIDVYTFVGLGSNLFGLVMLWYVVSILGEYWTVKLMIAKNHPLIKHPLFTYVKHPNYYLNILPELVGLGLLCHAWAVLACLGPFYLICLWLRIQEEDVAIREELVDTQLIPS